MRGPQVGEAALELAWLAPSAATLAGLARAPRGAWDRVRHDPAGVLLLARHSAADSSGNDGPLSGTPAILESILPLLTRPGFINWRHPALADIYSLIIRQATLARELAEKVDGTLRVPGQGPRLPHPESTVYSGERAWTGAILAPLGWLAVCAAAPEQVAHCRAHPRFAYHAADAQQECWGLDHTAIARRLARRWNLPSWLGTIAGHLGLPASIARALGAEPELFQIVQLAVAILNEAGQGLGLAVGGTLAELRAALGLSHDDVNAAWKRVEGLEFAAPEPWEAPTDCPLLGDLLHLAIAEHRKGDQLFVERLQHDLDYLQRALEEQCASERDRLGTKKMAAMAELAAGAGHEINNPLAVISGQAQYLLGREADPERRKALQTIVGQAQRIHQIVLDLMQFARPSGPHKQYIEIGALLRGVAESLQALALDRRVRLDCPEPPAGIELFADPAQVRVVLNNLLRNAIEAAPAEGWAGIRAESLGEKGVEIVVEDNGPGPPSAAQEHMFDPFYSGRSAGRGRGLGLPTAWRLAQQNNGQVRFAGHASGVTRFVFWLPQVRCPAAVNGTNGETVTNGTATNGANGAGNAVGPQGNGTTIIVSTTG